MYFALNDNGEKVVASPKSRGKCPFCGLTVIACVGELKDKYWRHEQTTKTNCVATLYENEGPWHNTWKHIFGKEFAEIFCQSQNEKRIADVKLSNGLVIEIQHSPISTKEIQGREKFHKKMIWVFDASGPVEAGRLYYEKSYFSWEQPRESIKNCSCPVFLDLGYGNVFEIDKFTEKRVLEEDWHTYTKLIFQGTGKQITRDEFKKKMEYTDIAIKQKDYRVTFAEQFKKIQNSIQLTIF